MKTIPSATVLLGQIDRELNRVARLIDGLVMAIADEAERDVMHELIGDLGPKLFAMKAALRDTLTSEQKETTR